LSLAAAQKTPATEAFMPSSSNKRARSPSAGASEGGAKRSKPKARVSAPMSPDLSTKKKIKAHSAQVKAEADAQIEASIAKAKKKVDARDEIIRSCKRAILAARGRGQSGTRPAAAAAAAPHHAKWPDSCGVTCHTLERADFCFQNSAKLLPLKSQPH